MEPEPQEGNIEYKLKLLNKTSDRIEELATQMRWRCSTEGNGECIYNLGVEDDGTIIGLSDDEYNETIKTIKQVVTMNNYSISELSKTYTENNRYMYELLIREINDNEYIDVNVAVAGPVDAGKCMCPSTPVIRYNGKIDRIDQIKLGDYLMGDDSTPREVMKIYQGETDMYKVNQTRGDDYIVTNNHILTLKFGSPTVRKYKKKFVLLWHSGNGHITREYYDSKENGKKRGEEVPNVPILDISVKDYITKSREWKTMFLGYSVPISYPYRPVKLDPYLLGHWLGDGHSARPSFTTVDEEVLHKIESICSQQKWSVKKIGNSISYSIDGIGNTITKNTKSGISGIQYCKQKNRWKARWTNLDKKRYMKSFSIAKYGYEQAKQNAIEYLTTIKNRTTTTSNPFWDMIEFYSLDNNKHIPDIYLYNSKEIRLKLLAGLIDSDGYLQNNVYEIVQKNKTLANQIQILTRSLGFKTNSSTVTKKCYNSPEQKVGVYYKTTFSGEGLDMIPVVLQYKKACKWKSNVRPFMNTIKITKIGHGKYYGFELDNNGRFLLGDNTVTHNSSFLGTLTTGKLDDGKGSARLSIFNYPHEVKTGRTSSVGHHIIGYDSTGNIVNYTGINGKLSWPDIVKRSNKIISLFDLAGHEKYLKTTILGLTANKPDLCLIMVGANKGIRNEKRNNKRNINQKRCDNMTREHMFLCITLGIPFAIIVTKIDMITNKGLDDIYKQTMDDIHGLIKCPGVRRQPIEVKTTDDALICAKQVHTESIVPIFTVSNVSGIGHDNVKYFLNLLMNTDKNCDKKDACIFIENIWSVPGVGTVVGGNLVSGTIRVNDKVYIGPNNGTYESTIVRSIHSKRVPIQIAKAGSFVCLGLKKFDRKNVRRGNVVLSTVAQQVSVKTFKAEIKVLRTHATTIRIGYESVLHVAAIRQTVALLGITNKISSRNGDNANDNILRTGDTAIGTFMFSNQPEYISIGMKLLFSEGKTKVVGTIIEI